MNSTSETPTIGTVRAQRAAEGHVQRLVRRLRTPQVIGGAASIIAGILIWELAVTIADLNPLIVSPPSAVIERALVLWEGGELSRHVSVSARQFVAGYATAAAIGISVGLLIGQFRPVRWSLEPWIVALYATPSIALAPLFIVWLGFGFTAKAFIIALSAFFPIVMNTIAGVDELHESWTDVADAFGAGRFERFYKVSLPGSMPYIFAGLRLGVGRGLVGIVVADFFGAQAGIGFLILRAAQTFRTPEIFVGTLLLAVFGVLLTGGLRALEAALSPWKTTSA